MKNSKGFVSIVSSVRIVHIKKTALEARYKLSMIVNERIFEELPTTAPSKKEKSELQKKDKRIKSKIKSIL